MAISLGNIINLILGSYSPKYTSYPLDIKPAGVSTSSTAKPNQTEIDQINGVLNPFTRSHRRDNRCFPGAPSAPYLGKIRSTPADVAGRRSSGSSANYWGQKYEDVRGNV